MGSLRQFQWALLHKIQEVEFKNIELAELRQKLVGKEQQVESLLKEVGKLRKDLQKAMHMAVKIPLQEVQNKTRIADCPCVTVAAVVVVARKNGRKRVAISAEPSGDIFAAGTILQRVPKALSYVSGL